MKKSFFEYIFLFFILLMLIFTFNGCTTSTLNTNVTSSETSSIKEQIPEYYKYDSRINDFFSTYNKIVSEIPITSDIISKGNVYSKVTINVNDTYIVLLNNEHNNTMYFDIDSDNIDNLKEMTFNILRTIDTTTDINKLNECWKNLVNNNSENLSDNITLEYNKPTQYYNNSQIKITYVYGE